MRKRDASFARLAWPLILMIAAASLSAQPATVLTVERQDSRLRLSAPRFHFIEGPALERLRDGATVTYAFSASVEAAPGGERWSHVDERFIVSYDLWEEKFAVVQDGGARRSASHLTAAAAEAWCLDNLLLRVPSAPGQKRFVVKIRCSVPGDDAPPAEALSLSALIDVFSRKGAVAAPHWEALSAPLRVGELKERTSK